MNGDLFYGQKQTGNERNKEIKLDRNLQDGSFVLRPNTCCKAGNMLAYCRMCKRMNEIISRNLSVHSRNFIGKKPWQDEEGQLEIKLTSASCLWLLLIHHCCNPR